MGVAIWPCIPLRTGLARRGDPMGFTHDVLKMGAMRIIILALAALLMVACQQNSLDLGVGGQQGNPQQPQARPLTPNVNGEKLGNGPVRVALLLPQQAAGGGGVVGKQMANAARLAMRDFGSGRLQLVIKETRGQAAEAQAKATEAMQEGASLVFGPLFSANVSAASAVTRPGNVPMVAFSSDANRAAQGVYLLSFPPQEDVRRIVTYGASIGANRIVAFLPGGAYGTLVGQELQRLASASGVEIIATHIYNGDGAAAQAARTATLDIARANAIYIPAGGAVPSTIIKSLKAAGAALGGMRILGSGQWESVNASDPVVNGALYPAASSSSFSTFASRYSASFGAQPAPAAALAYDAVSMAAELVRRQPGQPFSGRAIQSPSGFSGATGLFRFKRNGRIERGLEIRRIQSGSVEVVEPAPTNFRGG